MILLSALVQMFKQQLVDRYQDELLPSHYQALTAMEACRTQVSPLMKACCDDCRHQLYIPHSCGHRLCPHCQHHESQQWLERQLEKLVPADYFLLTFTLPAQFRPLAWSHQRAVYNALMQCGWETLNTFSHNDKQLQGTPGAIAVLHTHARDLSYHPHVHIVIPAIAFNAKHRLLRRKKKRGKSAFLFHHKALAKVFRAKMLAALTQAEIALPKKYPGKWVVDCKAVGSGDKALVYLGRYLYRGVIQEKDIVALKDGLVTYRFKNSDTQAFEYRTLPAVEFLWRLLKHVLPRRFRRARNYGFLHPNSKQLILLVQLIFKVNIHQSPGLLRKRAAIKCPRCGGTMSIVKTQIPPTNSRPPSGINTMQAGIA